MKTKKEILKRLAREKKIDDNLWEKFWKLPDGSDECELVRKKLAHQGEIIDVLEWILY